MAGHYFLESNESSIDILVLIAVMGEIVSELQPRIGHIRSDGNMNVLDVFRHSKLDRGDCVDVEVVFKQDGRLGTPHRSAIPGEVGKLLLHLHL